jgi:CoA:oxalate CoA-transferase
MSTQKQALAGLKILDFSHVYQGPVGTQILADYGADVIKVERPGSGDWSRAWGPFVKEVSLPFANLNRNKRSLALNLKSEAGIEIVHKLILEADVVVHNFRKGVMEKNGLGYEQVKALNPGIIYAWSSGWGDAGPYADRGRAGHDMMARAEGGWFVELGEGQAPIPGGVSIDYCAGMNLINGIMMAFVSPRPNRRGAICEH